VGNQNRKALPTIPPKKLVEYPLVEPSLVQQGFHATLRLAIGCKIFDAAATEAMTSRPDLCLVGLEFCKPSFAKRIIGLTGQGVHAYQAPVRP